MRQFDLTYDLGKGQVYANVCLNGQQITKLRVVNFKSLNVGFESIEYRFKVNSTKRNSNINKLKANQCELWYDILKGDDDLESDLALNIYVIDYMSDVYLIKKGYDIKFKLQRNPKAIELILCDKQNAYYQFFNVLSSLEDYSLGNNYPEIANTVNSNILSDDSGLFSTNKTLVATEAYVAPMVNNVVSRILNKKGE